jgi:hypothetical protein
MKRKHQLRLIELEESVLLAQVNNKGMNLIVKEIIGFCFYCNNPSIICFCQERYFYQMS